VSARRSVQRAATAGVETSKAASPSNTSPTTRAVAVSITPVRTKVGHEMSRTHMKHFVGGLRNQAEPMFQEQCKSSLIEPLF
jgi:hypothetical protein